MTTESKKHHYVPQSLLKRFSIDSKEKQIYVFDKRQEKSYQSSIIDSGSENKYNTIQTDFGEINLEVLYQDIDNLFPAITSKIIDLGSFKQLDSNDLYSVALITANQLRRTKLQRTTIDYINKELYDSTNKILKELKRDFPKSSYKRLSKEEIKVISIFGSLQLEEDVKSLLTKGIYLIKNISKTPFIISDCPVVMHNSFKYSGKGINEKGIEIYFPISPQFIIGFCCETVIGKLELAEKYGVLKSEGLNLLKSINEDVPFEIKASEHIEFYNQQQVINSYRSVYSSLNDFSLAREIVQAIPEIKENDTTIKVGEIGKAPPPNRNLPMGDNLVIFGAKDHNLLPIKMIEYTDTKIVFSCDKNFLLKTILLDKPYERIEYYADQHLKRLIGQPDINLVNKDKNFFELTHRDKAFNKVIEEIKKIKNAR